MQELSQRIKRIAVNTLLVDELSIHPAVVELQGNRVLSFQPLTEEIAMTEWVGGTLRLKKEGRVYKVSM